MRQLLSHMSYTGRGSIVVICAVAWLWLAVHNVVVPSQITIRNLDQSSSKPLPLPPCENTEPPAAATRLSQILFPVSEPEKNNSWVGENHKALRALFRCMELSNCEPQQKKVVISSSHHFRGVLRGSVGGGEDMWARSTTQALHDLGYTFLYTNNMERAVQIYYMIPDLVKIIITQSEDAYACFANKNCILSDQNPDGIPAWKIFSFNFWTGPDSPLGRQWTLSPEDYSLEGYPPNVYLGYSVEPSCLSQPFVQHTDREKRAYVMTETLYFLEDRERAWPPHYFEAASTAANIQFIMGANDNVDGHKPVFPQGLKNLGAQSKAAFVDDLSKSLVLVGVGKPFASPTPYEALCLGVPFINPILTWNKRHPEDRSQWGVQHGLLKFLDPPYVYNVFKDDMDGFVKAIQNAKSHPIDRHVLERMRMSSVAARLRAIVERDLKGEAAELLAYRKANGEGPLFIL